MLFAKTNAGIPTFQVESILAIKATQQTAAAAKMARVESNIPIFTSFLSWLAPILLKKAANHNITNPPYEAPEANGLPSPT